MLPRRRLPHQRRQLLEKGNRPLDLERRRGEKVEGNTDKGWWLETNRGGRMRQHQDTPGSYAGILDNTAAITVKKRVRFRMKGTRGTLGKGRGERRK